MRTKPRNENETATEPHSSKGLFSAARAMLDVFGLPFYGIVVVASITILGLPGLTGHAESGTAWRFALTPFWFAIAIGLPQVLRRLRRMLEALRETQALVVLAFLGSLGLGMLWSVRMSPDVNLPSALGLIMIWGTVALFGWVGTSWMPPRTDRLLNLAGLALLAYEFFNFVLYLAGTGNLSLGGDLRILGMLGIAARRVTFPMVSGPNSFGSIAGAALAWSSLWAWQTRRGSMAVSALKVMSVILSLACVLLADSRGGLILGGVGAVLVIGLSERWIPRLRWAVVLPILAPLSLLLGDTYAGALGLQGLWSMVNDLGSLSSRFITWRAAFSELLAPKWIHLIGFGFKGDVTSGVAEAAARIVKSRVYPLLGPHNAVLQYLLDNGIVGAALFVLLMFTVLTRLTKLVTTDERFAPALALMVYLTLVGTIERIPTVYSQELFIVFLLAVVFTLLGRPIRPGGNGENGTGSAPAWEIDAGGDVDAR